MRSACDMSRACRPTNVSPISPSISARGVSAATESTTTTSTAPERNKRVCDLQRLFAGIRLGNQHGVNIHADTGGIVRVKRVLGVDECDLAAALLRLCDDMQCKRRFTGGFRTVDLDNSALGYAADTERGIERQRTGRDRVDLQIGPVAKAHDRTLAEVFLDLPDGRIKRLLLVIIGSLIGCFFSFPSSQFLPLLCMNLL